MDYSLRPGVATPPLFEPNAQLMFHLIEGRSLPLTLIAGAHWLKYDGRGWTVDADEPATDADVVALLVEVGGITTWWGA